MASIVEDSLIKTSSIEQVLAPIATHLCYLKLLWETESEPEEFTQLEKAAYAVAKASKNMSAVASRVIAESDDKVMRMEMNPLLKSLTVSGQHVLLATQKLSIQPEVTEHKEELIEATQNVLLGVVKILLVEDDSTIRKINASAHWLLECLTQVGAAMDIQSLLKAFRVFSKAMQLLHNLVVERIRDLRDHRQQDHVKASMESLRKCLSMLHTAMCTTIKHPTSDEAQDAKKFILHQVDTTVNDIMITLTTNCEQMSTDSYGYYAERRNRLLGLLSSQSSSLFKSSDFEVVLRELVFHSMAVGNSSRREVHRYVAANCRLVLQFWSDVSQQAKCSPDKHMPKVLQENLISLIKQIHRLDEAVVKATLFQVMDIFVVTSSPLEQLVNTVHCISESETGSSIDLDPLQPFSKAFVAYADRVAEVASFISALANDKKSLDSVENSRVCLMHLKDAVTPLLLELGGDFVQYHGALHKLIDVHQKWVEESEQLLNAFSNVINIKDFMHLAVQEMKHDLKNCVEAHKEQDHHLLRKHIHFLIGRMSQVIQFVKRHVDKSDDPIYRNGLLVLVRQAENSAAEVTGCTADIFTTNLDEDEFCLLSDSISVAIKNCHILHEGLDGLQHPHLLSPMRKGARQPAVIRPVAITDPHKLANDQASSEHVVHTDEKEDLAIRVKDEFSFKDGSTIVYQSENREIIKPTFIISSAAVQTPKNGNLLPLLCEVVQMTKGKDIEALNTACLEVVELSSCYTQAAKEAVGIVEVDDNQEIENVRFELVALTPLLVQTAQETAMNSAKSTDTVYRHCSQFSDLIKNARKILLPVAGVWYHAIQAMIHSHIPNTIDSCIQQLNHVICLCADTVQLVTSTDIKVSAEGNESITSLLNKLQKAQTNTKNLSDLLGSNPIKPGELDGPCILWALSIQVVLNSLDRVLGTVTTRAREQLQSKMTPKKLLAAMSENSLRIQEAARLSSLNCKNNYKGKLLKQLQNEVETLTEVYLQTAEELGTVCKSRIFMLAKTELLQRQLQVKMRVLICLLSKVNEEYSTAIQNTISLACLAITKEDSIEAKKISKQFEASAESLLGNVQTATQSMQDCVNFIRDPRERSSLKLINDHLLFQISEIVNRARLMVETHSLFETLSLDIQTQCWSAKAHYLVKELFKVEGILHVTKEQIKVGLQGKDSSGALETAATLCSIPKETTLKREHFQENALPVNILPEMNLLSHRSTGVFSSVDPTLTYNSLFLKHEARKWDVHGNQIVQVTKEMADKIYHMTQYLKRKGPIQNKEAFVTSAKNLVSSCQSITQFVRVIADYCLDKNCTKELVIIADQIVTITNQLTIISRVNTVTPGSKSSDEILVKNAQNLLQTVIQGVRAAETACIKGLRQPEPNSEAAKAASLCFQWKKNLLIHRAQEQLNPETDDLGLRKTSLHHAAPSLIPSMSVLKRNK